jgi:hypothetical protein
MKGTVERRPDHKVFDSLGTLVVQEKDEALSNRHYRTNGQYGKSINSTELSHSIRRPSKNDPGAAENGKWAEGQRTEDRGQRTEDRGQRTEDRGQRTEAHRTQDTGQRHTGHRTQDTGNP